MPLVVRRPSTARRLLLRLCPATRSIRLSVPPRIPDVRALAFLAEQQSWLERQAQRLVAPLPFEPGGHILHRGLWIRLVAIANGTPLLEAGELRVPGSGVRFDARVRQWLRAQARDALVLPTVELAAHIGRSDIRVRLSDPKSRWGSCAANGRIMLSWRIVLAPEFVQKALIAHEVAHLAEMNHGPAFWAVARRLLGGSHAPARRWLSEHGALLHAHGVRPVACIENEMDFPFAS